MVRIVLWLGPTSQDPSVVMYLLCLGALRNFAVFTQEEERMPLPKDAVLLYGVIWRED